MLQTNKDRTTQDWNERIWFIIVENLQEGPYSLFDLKSDRRFTPDTLVWTKGFKEWTPARFVPEMREIFKDESKPQPLHGPINHSKSDLGKDTLATLTMQQDPHPLLLWILILLTILSFMVYQLFYK